MDYGQLFMLDYKMQFTKKNTKKIVMLMFYIKFVNTLSV